MTFQYDKDADDLNRFYAGLHRPAGRRPMRHCILCGAEYSYRDRASRIPDANDLCDCCYNTVHAYGSRNRADRATQTLYDDGRAEWNHAKRRFAEDPERGTIFPAWAYTSTYAVVVPGLK